MPELSQVGHGWMLEHISVTDEEKGKSWTFKSRKWFGESAARRASRARGGGCWRRPSDPRPVHVAALFAEGLASRPASTCRWSRGGVRAARGQDHEGRAREDAARVRARGRGRRPGGEAKKRDGAADAFVAFGVADGVFMWRHMGIDAGLFSRRLMGVASVGVRG